MTLFMETTRISADKTAAEISALLGRAGAERVISEYATIGGRRAVVAIYFQLAVGGHAVPYRLPIRTAPIRRQLAAKRRRMPPAELDVWAERVAWRQILRWLEAQLALVQTEMASMAEVFLPYLQVSLTRTLYEQIEHEGFKQFALPAPPKEAADV